MLKTLKASLCVVLLTSLLSVLLMCESDARKIARSKELIREHAQNAVANKDAIATNKQELSDAWDRPIIYEFGEDFIVGTSTGFDGEMGTGDDIVVVIKTSRSPRAPAE